MSLRRIPKRFSQSTCSLSLVSFLLSRAFLPSAAAQSCGSQGVAAQVLGSGVPELQDKRASSSYLVWKDGQARVLVYGPAGNDFMPSTTEFVYDFFGEKHGAYRYLSELLMPGEEGSYKMLPHNVMAGSTHVAAFRSGDLAVYAVRVVHGQVPALARRVEVGGKFIVFSGDTNGDNPGLAQLTMNPDLFVAHNAVPEGAVGIERRLHMPPSVIGQIAEDAHVKNLVLSHRMLRTLGKEDQTQSEIKKRYSGPVEFANDLDCFPVKQAIRGFQPLVKRTTQGSERGRARDYPARPLCVKRD